MTYIYDFYLLIFTFKIIWLKTFPEFLSCFYITSSLVSYQIILSILKG